MLIRSATSHDSSFASAPIYMMVALMTYVMTSDKVNVSILIFYHVVIKKLYEHSHVITLFMIN